MQTLSLSSLKIRPTATGFALLIMTFIGFAMAVNYNNNLLYFLVFMIASLLITALILGYFNCRRIVLLSWENTPAFLGESAIQQIIVQNRGNTVREAFCLKSKKCIGQYENLLFNQSVPLQLNLPTQKRGVVLINRLQLQSTYPLAMFCFSRLIKAERQQLIYPRSQGDLNLDDYIHLQQNQSLDDADELHLLRDYLPTDNPKRIHWKSYAKQQTLLSADFSGGESHASYILSDTMLAALPLEARLSQLTAWVRSAEKRGDEYGLQLGSQQIAPNNGETHLTACLTALALFQEQPIHAKMTEEKA